MISDNSLTFLRFRFRERVYWITRARSTGSEKGREIQLIGEKFGFVSACDIDRKRWKNRSTKSVAKRVSNRPWNVCRKIDGKWGSEGERFPKRAPNRRILATPREPLNDISEIARGNIRPVDLASWVSQRATTSRVTIWVGWVRKIGARGDIPFTLIASKRLFTFSFPRTKSNGLLDYGIARKFSSYLSSYLDADNVGRQCFQQHYGFSSYCFHLVEQTAIFVTRSFWDSLKKKRFEETRYFVDRQAGKEK